MHLILIIIWRKQLYPQTVKVFDLPVISVIVIFHYMP